MPDIRSIKYVDLNLSYDHECYSYELDDTGLASLLSPATAAVPA